jgi:hypothetical protein
MPIPVIVPCDHPFGMEAPADPPWPGLLANGFARIGFRVSARANFSKALGVSLAITLAVSLAVYGIVRAIALAALRLHSAGHQQ